MTTPIKLRAIRSGGMVIVEGKTDTTPLFCYSEIDDMYISGPGYGYQGIGTDKDDKIEKICKEIADRLRELESLSTPLQPDN